LKSTQALGFPCHPRLSYVKIVATVSFFFSFFFFNATFKFGFGFWYDFFLFGLHFFVCFTQFLFYFCWEPKEPKEKRIARWGNFPAQVFFLLFFLRFFVFFFFCCISFGFLGTSLRASQKQLGRLLLIVLFEYFTAGIAATLRLMASLVVTPLGGGGLGYIFSALFFVCLCVRNY